MRRVFYLSIYLIMVLVIPYHTFAEDIVKIGTLNPVSGVIALSGRDTQRGIEIAAKMQNRRGGVQGKKIVLMQGDSQTIQTAVSEAERLINVEGVKLFCGEFSSARAKAATTITEKYRCINVIVTALADEITSRGFKYVFQASPRAYFWGELSAKYMAEVAAPMLGKKPSDLRVALAHEDSDFGTSIIDSFVENAKKYKLNILLREPYSAAAVDLSSLVLRVKQANPDALAWVPYIRDGILFLEQAKAAGVSPKVIHGAGGVITHHVFREKFGDDMNYMLTTAWCSWDVKKEHFKPEAWTALQEFDETYRKEYNEEVSQDAFHGFVGAWMFFHFVLTRTKSFDPDDVEKTMREINIAPGESVTTFGYKFAPMNHSNPGSNLIGYPNIFQWQKGSIKHLVYPEKFAQSKMMLPMPPWGQRSIK